jgi:hypothetical protein
LREHSSAASALFLLGLTPSVAIFDLGDIGQTKTDIGPVVLSLDWLLLLSAAFLRKAVVL